MQDVQSRLDVPSETEGTSIPLDAFPPYLMNLLMGQLNKRLNDGLVAHGLSFQYWRVLLVLVLRGARNLSELVQETMIPQSTLSRVIVRMERGGLVVRSKADGDSRILNLNVTPAGRARFQSVYPLALREHHRALDLLTADEQALFTRLLQKMVRGVCDESPD
ncbi:MAG: MarR family transcriptional regulator [Aquisalimonadaceae bacterium]